MVMGNLFENDSVSELIKFNEMNKGKILSVSDRLDFYLKVVEVNHSLNITGTICMAVGYQPQMTALLNKALEVEGAVLKSCILYDYGFNYSQSQISAFHEARLFITKFFIENYEKMDRFELSEEVFRINKDKRFLAVLAENTNTFIYPEIVFKALFSAMLAQLYVLVDKESEAISSLMNASFFYGANIKSSEPLTEHQVKSLINIDISRRTQLANKARWQGHVEQLRRRYLELDKQRQGESGKQLTIKAVAKWIERYHNQEDLELETIRNHLSKARKGIFTNE